MTAPFTYLIGWTNLGCWYIGARWAKGCAPSDLWTTYFTSSKRVAALRKSCGEPDIVEIDRVFSSKKEALLREIFLLRLNGADKRADFLNKAIGGAFDPADPEIRQKLSESHKGKVQSPELVAKRMAGKKGMPHSAEHRERIRVALTGKRLSEAHCASISAALQGNTRRRGTTTSEEGRKNIGAAKVGSSHSDETRRKMSEAHSRRNLILLKCPYCPKMGGATVMKSWHFDKCKFKGEAL